jgi:hypothetical protein
MDKGQDWMYTECHYEIYNLLSGIQEPLHWDAHCTRRCPVADAALGMLPLVRMRLFEFLFGVDLCCGGTTFSP